MASLPSDSVNVVSDTLMNCNYLEELPVEIAVKILNMLDWTSFFYCLYVSVGWRQITASCNSRWRKACLALGASNTALALDDAPKRLGLQHYCDMYYKLARIIFKPELRCTKTFTAPCDIIASHVNGDILGVACINDFLYFVDVNTVELKAKLKLKCKLIHKRARLWFNKSKLVYGNDNKLILHNNTDVVDLKYKLETSYTYNCGHLISVQYVDVMDIVISLHSVNRFDSNTSYLKVWATKKPYGLLHDIDIGITKHYEPKMASCQKSEDCYTIVTDCDNEYRIINLRCSQRDDNCTKLCATMSTVNVRTTGFSPNRGGGQLYFTEDGLFVVLKDLILLEYSLIQLYDLKLPGVCSCTEQSASGCMRLIPGDDVMEPLHGYVVEFTFTECVPNHFLGIGDKFMAFTFTIDPYDEIEPIPYYEFVCFLPLHSPVSKPICVPFPGIHTPKAVTNLKEILNGFDQAFSNSLMFTLRINARNIGIYGFCGRKDKQPHPAYMAKLTKWTKTNGDGFRDKLHLP